MVMIEELDDSKPGYLELFRGSIEEMVADLGIENVLLFFRFKDTVYVGKTRYSGWCRQNGNSNIYTIYIGIYDIPYMIDVIAHELRHVYQSAKGLNVVEYDTSKNKWVDFWKGKKVVQKGKNTFNTPYEIDARNYEKRWRVDVSRKTVGKHVVEKYSLKNTGYVMPDID